MHRLHIVLLTCLLTMSAFGQQNFATLMGVVTDSSGAIVPNVVVTAVDLASNQKRETRTDATGNYSLPFLKPGTYSVTAAADGFKKQSNENITLQVQQVARVDFSLTVGSVSDQITVEASGAILQTENSTLGTVIDSNKIVDLPLNGRNFVQLAQLIPGVQGGTPGSIATRSSNPSIGGSDPAYGTTAMSANGNRDTQNRFYFDGIEFSTSGLYYPFSPSVDSLAEFKVETSTYSAETGGAPGGQVNLVTRSGTNRYKGTLWEFNRNNQLTQSYDAIAGKSATPPRLNRNQFGLNFGGPLLIPKIYSGKDRTFVFFNWESGRLAQGVSARYTIVPTEAMRNGDFRGLVNASTGQPITLKDPLNIGIVNNVIPKQFLNKQAQVLLGFTPLPNTSTGSYNYLVPSPSVVSRQQNFLGRVDHTFSPRDVIFGRIVVDDRLVAGTPYWGNDEFSPGLTSRHLVASYVHTFSPRMVNEMRGGLNSLSSFQKMGTSYKPEYDIANLMGLPMTGKDPAGYGPPTVSVSGADGAFSLFNMQRNIGPQWGTEDNIQIVDTLSWQRGNHFLKFGADIIHRLETLYHLNQPRGTFSFDGLYTGSALADYILGYVRSASINPNPSAHELRDFWHAYFFNDDWKVTPRLSLTFGLRYDYFQPYTEVNNKLLNIEMNGFEITRAVDPTNATCGAATICPDRKNFSPRLGFAYRPSFMEDAVIRGGYGIYYIPMMTAAIDNLPIAYNSVTQGYSTGSLSGIPDVFFSNPFTGSSVVPNRAGSVSIDQYLKSSYTQQWNLSVQKRLPANILLDVGYVGSKGNRLLASFTAMNRPIQVVDPRTPGLASVNARRPNQNFQRAIGGEKSVGMSIYHALQAKVERRLAKGLTFLTSYTWSKAISSPTDNYGLIGGGWFIANVQDMYNFRSDRSVAVFDVTQRSVSTILYDLPFFRNSKGLSRTILGGWQVSTIATFQSGFPAPVAATVDTTGTGIVSRPDMVAGQTGNLPGSQRSWNRWFNTAAFTVAPYGRFGNSPREGAFRLPGITNFDFAANKFFRFGERGRVEIRGEFYNLFNNFNPDPSTVDRRLNSVTFGKVGGGVSGITTRVIQLGAKLYF